MTPFLQLDNISYSYDGGKNALDGVSLSVCPGERIALLGGNGAGKSTLFLCCNGVLRPRSGRVLLRGAEISGRKALTELRKSVGIVFQDPDDQMIASTVEGEVSFGPMNLALPRGQIVSLTDRALSAMNLTEYRTRPPHYLSGGEKKRVSIADVLAMEPGLILFDEPTAGLDAVHTAMLEKTLSSLHERGIALLVSTHDADMAWRFADRAIILSSGRILDDGPARDVFAKRELLTGAGLCPPVMFELAETLKLPDVPRTMEEFKCMIKA